MENELSPDTTVGFNVDAVFFCLKETLAPIPPRGHGQALPHQDTLRGVQHLQPGRCSPARPEEVPCVPGGQGSCGHPASGTGEDGVRMGDTTGPFLCDAHDPQSRAGKGLWVFVSTGCFGSPLFIIS